MTKKPMLVDLAELRTLMMELELGDAKRNEYINARWLKYVEWWDFRASRARWKYFALRSAVVIGSALIPALVGLRELHVWGDRAWIFAVASIIASLVVAVCAGVESLFGFGDIWREKRAAAELIKSEGFSFLQLSGNYNEFTTHVDAFRRFATNVEALIRSEIKEYIVAASSKPAGDKEEPAGQES
jgi:hypothetical protein